ncbi:methylated-DNA--[protein]-cysteine S-methyltransferase [Methylocapsa sp. S129]|uniref:methylated-DNA--[protein]-cysteine S-methyltransferase n=1 Tax=Methylocapsa sp. S129 TaxID=1641869 RepID=UPI00131D5D56|nr:methylated-DNA--[protein]-cysteine S-methyltransferase [Methylocapsa sp. S129]
MNAIFNQAPVEAEELRFTCGDSWLGAVLVAVSSQGVASILIGDHPDKLRRELAAAFPQARLVSDGDGLREPFDKVVDFLEAPGRGLDITLDVRGSALERAVWKALRAIPSGQTATYGQIAKTLPTPATAQEVGAACAANVLAVAIPCHRVVKADGSISGYRWGVGRKKRLINREAVA